MPRNYKLILDAIPIGRGFDRIIGFLQMHGAIGPEFARALNEEVSLEQAAVNMTRAADAAIREAPR